MKLDYENKLDEECFLRLPAVSTVCGPFVSDNKMLFHGDNIDVLKFLLQNGYENKIDLIYIDPPFATKNIFTIGDKRVSTISNSKKDKNAYSDSLTGSDFVEFIRLRLILLHKLLSEKGSLYLHIDYKVGHYIKVIMDEIFGSKNFRNDIARIKCNPKNFSRKAYGNIKDLILFYSKGNNPIWHDPKEPLKESDRLTRFSKIDAEGRRYTTVPVHAPGETKNGPTGGMWRGMLPPVGRHWRSNPDELDQLDAKGLIEWSKTGNPRKMIYADDKMKEGRIVQDVWTYKDPPRPSYPTEKNFGMLERIIKTSSDEKSIVLDCFCGSGTTLVAAENLNRNWIGIDSSDAAINVTESRLAKRSDLFSAPYKKYEMIKKGQKKYDDAN